MRDFIETRKDFINTFFDNAYGLTLDQIEKALAAVDDLSKDIYENLLSDGAFENCKTDKEKHNVLMANAYSIFLSNIQSCKGDLLEIRDYFKELDIELTDIQTFRMSLL